MFGLRIKQRLAVPALLLFLAAVLAGCPEKPPRGSKVALTPSTQTAGGGEQVTVSVVVNGVTSVRYAAFGDTRNSLSILFNRYELGIRFSGFCDYDFFSCMYTR